MGSSNGEKLVRLRSVFLSDIHLGSRDSHATELLQFLASVEVDYLFLVGDIVDFWSLRKTFYWPQAHNDVLRAILGKARDGAQVIYIPGNHDENMREFCGTAFGNLKIRRRFVHSTADGREFLVMHGDEFDAAVKCSRWLAWTGNFLYDFVLSANRVVNGCRRMLGMQFWSLAGYVKLRLKNAVRYVEAFERAAASAAAQRGLDGIVCGHIHRAGVREIGEVLYCNDGDWVESCTALVEEMNGRMSIWNWTPASVSPKPFEPLEAAA